MSELFYLVVSYYDRAATKLDQPYDNEEKALEYAFAMLGSPAVSNVRVENSAGLTCLSEQAVRQRIDDRIDQERAKLRALNLPIYWHFARLRGNFLWNNVFLHKGVLPTISRTAITYSDAVTGTDIDPLLRGLEPVLEHVRSSEFPKSPSRRGAFFAFEDEKTCQRYLNSWTNNPAEFAIVSLSVAPGSKIHRGHLGWSANPPRERWTEVARSYWAGLPAAPPHDWELVIDGLLIFKEWDKQPFGIFAGLI